MSIWKETVFYVIVFLLSMSFHTLYFCAIPTGLINLKID